MKVSYDGKIKKVSEWPESMQELRKVVSRKFTERSLIDETSHKNQKRKHLIDWEQVHVFYEDSEGDLNVVSEEEDLSDAHTYALMKAPALLNLSIVSKDFYQQIRSEQESSMLNQSETWLKSDAYRNKPK